MQEEQRQLEEDVVNSIKSVKNAVIDVLRVTKDVGLTQSIVVEALKKGSSGQKITENENEKMQEDVTKIQVSGKSKLQEEKKMIQPTVSPPSSDLSEMVESDSMSLLQSSTKHLHDLMKSVTGPIDTAEDNPMRRPEIERVNAAANCAKQLYSMMRLQLDAARMMRMRMRK